MPKHAAKMPSQRQLRVGEELRHALSEVFMRGESHIPELDSASITVSEVRISPDLKNASVYVLPLAGRGAEHIVPLLNEVAPTLRKVMMRKVVLKYAPKLTFKMDKSFETADRINTLLNQPEVRRDIVAEPEDESGEEE